MSKVCSKTASNSREHAEDRDSTLPDPVRPDFHSVQSQLQLFLYDIRGT